VHVFERETVAWGASGRNGGMATPDLAIGFRDAIARYGFETAAAYRQSYSDAIDTIEKLVADEGIDCAFARTGKMVVADKPAHVDRLRKTHEVLSERLGCPTFLVPRSELGGEIGVDGASNVQLAHDSSSGCRTGGF
jgi:glycine/D-amino acid oxidase-like deaminating enzyme